MIKFIFVVSRKLLKRQYDRTNIHMDALSKVKLKQDGGTENVKTQNDNMSYNK